MPKIKDTRCGVNVINDEESRVVKGLKLMKKHYLMDYNGRDDEKKSKGENWVRKGRRMKIKEE
jgi:hypothetical protein